jgi:hypothetical protein
MPSHFILALFTLVAVSVPLGAPAAPAPTNTLEDVFAVRDTHVFDRPAVEAALAGPVLLLRSADGTLSAVEAATGALLWRKAAELGPEMRFRVRGELVLLSVPQGLEAVRLANGMRAWAWAPGCVGPCRTRLIADDRNLLLAESSDGQWHALDPMTGRQLWKAPATALVGGDAAIGNHAIVAAIATWAGGIELAFHDRDSGRPLARWKSPAAEAGFAPIWRVTPRGVRVLLPGPPLSAGQRTVPLAQVLIVDATGRTAETRVVQPIAGVGTRVRWFGLGADEAWLLVDDPASQRSHLLRINDRHTGRIDVEIATGLSLPFEHPSSGSLVFPPSGDSVSWGIMRADRKLWRAHIEGMNTAARGFAVDERHGLVVHHDGMAEADVALEKVTGVGVLELDATDPILVVGWSGRTPLVVQGTRVTLFRRMKVIEVRDKLRQAEARGVDTVPLRERIGRFRLLRERIGEAPEVAPSDFEPTADPSESPEPAETPTRPQPAGPTGQGAPAPATTPPPTSGPGTTPPTNDVRAPPAPTNDDAQKAMALFPDESATINTLRDAWLNGEHGAVAQAAATWLERARIPAAEPQRVAGALGWLFFEVAVAPDRADGLEWLLAPARVVALVREGLPPAERVVWALIAARAGDGGLAATFLDGDALRGGLAASARRALALRAMKGMRDSVGDLRQASARAMFGAALAAFPHIDLLFGASAQRVRDLSGRLEEDPTVMTEIDGYLHVIGIRQLAKVPMDVETCVLACDVVAQRCGFTGDTEPCVKRCLKNGSARLAGVPKANPKDAAWFCGL